MPHSIRKGRSALALATLLTGAVLLTGCTAGGTAVDTSGDQLLTIPREDMGTFSRNFNPFTPNAAPMTQQAVYESMLVYNPADGGTTPWLATDWAASDDGLELTFTMRDGVTWSDGEPMVAGDVAYTFELQKELLGGFEYLDSVEADSDQSVRFILNRPYSPALYEIGQQIIVPQHIWEEIDDPAKDTNGTPVGTGPYTEVTSFQSQSFDLGKNPNYWQPEKQKIAGIRMLAFAGNDGANLAAVNGEVDWAYQFMPDIEKSFVAKDPEHRQFWFPSTGSMINWQLNTTKAPFDDVNVRKALSMAVDREQVTDIAMNGYTSPADCTGLSGAYTTWVDADIAASCDWTNRDVDAANALFDSSGYPLGADGTRTLPDGSPFTLDISVGSASSDWLSAATIIAQNLAEVGITAKVDSPDWPTVSASYEDGSFDTGIVWSNNAPTPYQFYRGVMSTDTVKPVGEKTFENYHRFASPEADALLATFAASSDPAVQTEAVNGLQAQFAADAPVIPLFAGPEWGMFTDTRFTGWPTASDPYATLSTKSPTTVLVLTSLEPVTK